MHTQEYKNRRMTVAPLLLTSLIASCFVTNAVAQESASENQLETVVVTASRINQLQKEAIPTTLVISQKDIENKRLSDLPGLLKSEAGIEISRMGSPGQVSSTYMRGANARQVLIMVDGVPVNDGNELGTPLILEQMQLDQIDHIEVVRGNVSAIYGSGAMGGVIQIFTKQGTGPLNGQVFAEYGTHKSTKLGASVSGETDFGTRYAVNLTRSRTDGISATNEKSSYGFNPDDDYAQNISFNTTLSQRIDANNEIGGKLFFYDAKFDYDGSGMTANDYGRSKQWMGQIYSKNRITEDWLSTVTASYTEHERHYNTDYDYGGKDRTAYKTQTAQLQWSNTVVLNDAWTATAGLDYAHSKIVNESRSAWGSSDLDHDRNQYSAYAGLLGNLGNHHIQANVRYDHVGDAGSDTTGYLGYSYDLTPTWKALASVSTAFLAPNLYQQYDPSSGNKDLESERSTNYEIGVQYAKDKDLVRLVAFQSHTRDMIDWYAAPGSWMGKYTNIGRAKNTGVELTVQSDVYGWFDVKGNLTWQNPKDRDNDQRLARRAKWFGSLDVSKTIGRWYFGGTASYQTHRYDGTSDQYDLTSYLLVDLNARYDINKHVSVYGRVENVLDKEYETAYGYNQLGRAGYIGVNVKM